MGLNGRKKCQGSGRGEKKKPKKMHKYEKNEKKRKETKITLQSAGVLYVGVGLCRTQSV